tara:strand:- start:5771 stop:7357 length:1587 start_codon:yes stop_codon:yes gene_type:complete
MKREVYKAKKSLTGFQKAPSRSNGSQQVINAAAGFATSLTQIGEAVINLNDTINTQEATGDAIKSAQYMTNYQDSELAYEQYSTDLMTGGNIFASAKAYADSIDSTGELSNKISSIYSRQNLNSFMSNARTKIMANAKLRAEDPGLHNLQANGIDGEMGPERFEESVEAHVKNGGTSTGASVLTKGEAQTIINTMKTGSSAQAQMLINQYFQGDSPYKQNIVNDLVRHGLGSEYAVMSYLPQHIMNTFIAGNRLTDEEWTAWKNANPNLLKENTKANIANDIATDATFIKFMDAYTGGSKEKSEQIASDMQRMVFNTVRHLMYSGTMNQSDAQDYVIGSLKDSFHMVNTDQVKVIMPKSQIEDFSKIEARLESITGNPYVLDNLLKNYDVEMLTSQQLEGMGIFTDEDNVTMYRRIIEEEGVWVSSDDGEGFMLMVNFPGAATQEPVATSNGEPLVISIEDTKKLYNFDGSKLSGTFLENGQVFSTSFWRRLNGKDGAFSSEYYRMESLNQETDKEMTTKEKVFKAGD